MKKILLIHSDEFLTKENPLGGIFQLDQALHLSKKYKVDILSAGLLSPRKFFLNTNKKIQYQKIKNIHIYRKYLKNILPTRFNYFNKIVVNKTAKLGLDLFEHYLKKNLKPDLIHAHDFRYASYIAYEIYKKYKIPYVITEHNSDILEEKFPTSLVPKTKKIIEKSHNVSTVSRFMSVSIKKYFKTKRHVKILHNVLGENFLKKIKFVKKKKIFTFIVITRFDKNKNLQMLIKSFKKFNSEIDNISNLKIIGDGFLFDKIKKKIKYSDLKNKIFLLGYQNRHKIIKHLLNSNCYISNSKVETFGVSTIEALSCGVPVILSENAGSLEIKNQIPEVLIYKPNDYLKLFNHMKMFYNLKKEINKKNLRHKTIKKFGVKNFLKQISKIYN